MVITSIVETIGNTPLLEIPENIHGFTGLKVYAKCEFLNPFGSVKDRTALALLKNSGEYSDIIESSSGNTAKALGILSNIHHKTFTTVTSKIPYQEVEDIIRLSGAKIIMLPPGPECPDPNDPNSPFAIIEETIQREPGKYYWTDQYTNSENPKIHRDTTAEEVKKDIGTPDYFFGGLGTTGTTLGFIEKFGDTPMRTIGIISESGSFLPGIRTTQEMAEVGLFDPSKYSDFQTVTEDSAIDAMLTLIRRCGMLVGPTSGASFAGMQAYLHKQNPENLIGKTAVFIACDRLETYTGYLREKRPNLFRNEEEISITPTIPPLHAAKTVKDIDTEQGTLLIDMRSYVSYDIAHIRGSLNFPFEELRTYLSREILPFPKESKLIFICPFGEESQLLAQMASTLGYDASSLEGGYLAYANTHPEQII